MSHRRTDRPPVSGDELDRIASLLPRFVPDSRRIDQVRAAILEADTSLPGRTARKGFLQVAALASATCTLAVCVWLSLRPDTSDPATPGTASEPAVNSRVEQSHAVVHPGPAARFHRVHSAPDELIRLHDGTMKLEVSPLASGDRFRVRVGSAWIEVRGTRFQVTALAESLISVEVAHGLVVLEMPGNASIWLAAGQRWDAEEPGLSDTLGPQARIIPPAPRIRRAPESLAKPPAASPVPVTSTRPREQGLPVKEVPGQAEKPTSPDERSLHVALHTADTPDGESGFRRGWTEFKLGHYRQAAAGFEESCLNSDPAGPGEDACYWYAVAIERSGDPGAIQAYRRFLERYPRSARAGEASVALGWLLARLERWAEAMRLFESAGSDPVPAVRQSARTGLDAASRALRQEAVVQ